MKANVSLTLVPFTVPDSVAVKPFPRPPVPASPQMPAAPAVPGGPYTQQPVAFDVPLSELEPVTLEGLCEQFRAEAYRKAGKVPPPEPEGRAISIAEPSRALNSLRAVLCDHDGNVSISGSVEDNRIIDDCLRALAVFLQSL